MKIRKVIAIVGLVGSLMLVMDTVGNRAFAQTPAEPAAQAAKDDETNLDTQLYLLVGTNQDLPDSRVPAALESVIKQLRLTLPFKNYRLAATLVNRVKNEGRLNLRWLGGPFAAAATTSPSNPTFSEFNVRSVKLVNSGNQSMVQLNGFSFQARMPIQTGSAYASNSQSAPIINYENTGLNTDISMREGEPVVVGTLNFGPAGEAIIIVVSAKRTNR